MKKLIAKDEKGDKKTTTKVSKTYYSFSDNNHAEERKASPLRFFSETSDDKIAALRSEIRNMDVMKYRDSNFRNPIIQFKQHGRLEREPVELTLLTERQSAEEDEDEDHDSKEIKPEKLSGKSPLAIYYQLGAFFIMSEKTLKCFEECGVSNYVAAPIVLTSKQGSIKWKDYWAVQFFGMVPSPLVVHYNHTLFREHETGFMFFEQSVRDALEKLMIKYIEFDKHVFKRNELRSKKMKLSSKELAVVNALMVKYKI